MFERPDAGERAVLVHVSFRQSDRSPDPVEFRELADSAGVETVGCVTGRRDRPDPKYFIGSGKAEELKSALVDHAADLVLFNHELSGAQERNLERLLQRRVVDRPRLILDIFAQRARSFEGKLQVELAQLRHLSTRLVRGWTHLERQKGGIGLRGPGETQLETDRRLIGQRIRQIRERLQGVRRQRLQGARARSRAMLSTVSIVGYTNAGKSTLFNRMTDADAYTADKLFATLDPTLRRVDVPGEHPVLLSDTVGFISDLPPELIAAFSATLEETRDAVLLLHVIDTSAEDRDHRIVEVERVLSRIGAESTPVIEVYNKIDLAQDVVPHVERNSAGELSRVWLSAATGEGLNLLLDAIADRLNHTKVRRQIIIPPSAGRLRARLYSLGAVFDETILEDGYWALEVVVPAARWRALTDELAAEAADIEVVSSAQYRDAREPTGSEAPA